MKDKNKWGAKLLISFATVLLVAFNVSLFFLNKSLFFVFLTATVILLIFTVIKVRNLKKYVATNITKSSEAMARPQSESLNSFSTPVMILSKQNEIIWYNATFQSNVSRGKNMLGWNVTNIIGRHDFENLIKLGMVDTVIDDRMYKAFVLRNDSARAVYLIDQTSLKRTEASYLATRPVVAYMVIDSLDELLADVKESRKVYICGVLQNKIEKWFSVTSGIMRAISNDRFVFIFEQRYLKKFEEEKFSILGEIREFEVSGKTTLTLSMGVGYGGNSFAECEKVAKKALDMSLGRGGDQVSVKSIKEDYRFYGGVKNVTKRSSMVKTRIIASTIDDIIRTSSRVVVLGHKFSDLDCLGAAYAMAKLVKSYNKPVNIIANTEESMAKPLLNFIKQSNADEYSQLFISGEKAVDIIDDNTLAIVVDTHKANYTDCPAAVNKAKTVVVIDHHRRAVDYINNAVIFFNETVSSSTCELVTEILQYMERENIDSVVSNALMSGIMLDTKNFVLNSGVRTFEAAAYLKRNGADTVSVKKLFAESMDSYKRRSEVIANAKMYLQYAS